MTCLTLALHEAVTDVTDLQNSLFIIKISLLANFKEYTTLEGKV